MNFNLMLQVFLRWREQFVVSCDVVLGNSGRSANVCGRKNKLSSLHVLESKGEKIYFFRRV